MKVINFTKPNALKKRETFDCPYCGGKGSVRLGKFVDGQNVINRKNRFLLKSRMKKWVNFEEPRCIICKRVVKINR